MKEKNLRIGKIPYANLFPIFYMLEEKCDCSGYEFVEGVPSILNRMLRAGEIDVSPSSSIEYLRHENRYILLDGHSISSAGPIGSILLFSKRRIEELDGSVVLASSQSETSVTLLEIIFKKFYGMDCSLRPANEYLHKALESYPAYLLIGDDALKAVAGYKLQVTSRYKNSELFVYDLGDIWHKQTGLPFTFALWIARRDCCSDRPVLFERFKKDLHAAKGNALKNFKSIAKRSPLLSILSEDEIVSYWQSISYDLNDKHKKGLALFRKYAEELNLI